MSTELQSRAQRTAGDRTPAHARPGATARAMASTRRRQPCLSRSPAAPPVQALAGVSLHAGHGELLAVVGPSGCGKTTLLELICGLQAPDAGTIECAPAALMPQRDLLLPWLSALDNAALALRIAGRATRAGPRAGRGAVRRARPGGLRAGAPARALRRYAPARRVPAHAALGQARPLPGRAVRRARRDHARGDAGVARPRAAARAAHGRARHPRRRGGGRARRPRRGALPPSRPGARGDRGRTSPAPARAPTRR